LTTSNSGIAGTSRFGGNLPNIMPETFSNGIMKIYELLKLSTSSKLWALAQDFSFYKCSAGCIHGEL